MKEGKKKALVIWPRRAGKDITIWDIVINLVLQRTIIVYYIFPTYSQARKALFDSMTNDGKKFLDFIPPETILRKNEAEMKLTFYNNSICQFVGSTDYDKLMGTNPSVCVFSEYSLQDPRAYQYIRPILTANNGVAIFCSTVRGKNHLFDLYNIAKDNPSWYCSKLSVDETQHVDITEIETEIAEGEMSRDLARQEYWNDFNLGVEGAYYAKYLDQMELDGRLGAVPWEPGFKVSTAWDLGMRDSTSILFFQVIGSTLHIIDTYQNTDQGLEHYIAVLNSKPWKDSYGRHFAPHDIKVRELGTGLSRLEKARQLGISFELAANIGIIDGIEAVRTTLPRTYINESTCKTLINALANYRKVLNDKTGIYDTQPLHDKHSHMCFTGNMKVLTYLGEVSIEEIKEGFLVRTPTGFKRVLKVHKRTTDTLCDIYVKDTVITCTKEHKFFSEKGLVSADSLRYNDVLEHYSIVKGFLWKKLYGYFSKKNGLEGFKRTILSLKMNPKSVLMDTFLDGMVAITSAEKQEKIVSQISIEPFGLTIMDKFLKALKFIIKTITQRITHSRIWNWLTLQNTENIIAILKEVGLNLKNVKTKSEVLMQKQKNGIEAPKVENGIGSMQNEVFQAYSERDIKRSAMSVEEIIVENRHGKDFALTRVKQSIVFVKDLISSPVLVASARLYLKLTNMLLRKHAVSRVQSYPCVKQKEVYDLTVEDDNCYYVNGYLVSNCDALRYLCVSLPKTRDSMTPEELRRIKNEAIYGETTQQGWPFRNNAPRF